MGNHVDIAYPGRVGSIIETGDAARILQGGAQAARGVRVEGTEQLHPRPVVDLTETTADNGLVTLAKYLSQPAALRARRVSDRDPRREIRLFKVVPIGSVVGRSSENKRNQRGSGIPDALFHVLYVLVKLLPEVDRRRRLEAVDLPGWREERPPHAVSNRQVRFDAPGVLSVEFVPVEPVVPLRRSARSRYRVPVAVHDVVLYLAALIEFVIDHDVRNQAEHGKHGEIVRWSGRGFGKPAVYGIQLAAASVGESGGGHPIGSPLSYTEGMLQAEPRIADIADIAAQLKGMLALGPGEIVQQIVSGRLSAVAVGKAWIQTVEGVPLLVRVPDEACALASEPPVEGVDHGWAEDGCVSHNESFAVVYQGGQGSRPRQEGLLWVDYILQSAAPKQSVFAVGGEVVIEAGSEGGVIEADRCAETEAHVVKAIAHGGVVTAQSRVGVLEVAEHGRIGPSAEGVEVSNIIRTEHEEAGLRCIRGQAIPLHRAARAGDSVELSVRQEGALVLKDAIAHGGAGNSLHRAVLFPPAGSLVIDKEKQTVLLGRTYHRRAEDISDQFVRFIRLPASHLRSFDEVVVGAGDGVAMVFVE